MTEIHRTVDPHGGAYTSVTVWVDAVIAEDGVDATPEIEILVHFRPGHEDEARDLLAAVYAKAREAIKQ